MMVCYRWGVGWYDFVKKLAMCVVTLSDFAPNTAKELQNQINDKIVLCCTGATADSVLAEFASASLAYTVKVQPLTTSSGCGDVRRT